MGNPLKNPPVFFTLVQVQFNPILNLAEFLPTIQENFRKSGYPDYRSEKRIVVQISAKENEPNQPIPFPHERHNFGNIENTHSFLLETNSLILRSTNYGQFETFSETFLSGLKIIHNAVDLAFTERIGLRYLDYVAPRGNDNLNQYLAPETLGTHGKLGGSLTHSYVETLTEIDKIKLFSRVVIRNGPPGFPPDLLPVTLTVAPRFPQTAELSAILDNDGFVELREPFSIDGVSAHLNNIHNIVRQAFKSMATKHAFAMWDQD